MGNKESKIQLIMHWIYILVATNALWLLGLILGIGIFSLIPTTITVFQLFNEMRTERSRYRLRVWRLWKQRFKTNLKTYWKSSLVFIVLFAILFVNYVFLGTATGLLTYGLFYITIFLILLVFFIFLWFSFILAQIEELNMKEVIKNAISYPVVHFIEMIILIVFIIAIILLIWSWLPGIIVFIGISGVLAILHWIFTFIFEGHNLRALFKFTWEKIF